MAGVPVVAIDPKGDLGNLLLAFPSARAGLTSSLTSTRSLGRRRTPSPGSGRRTWPAGASARPTVARAAASRECGHLHAGLDGGDAARPDRLVPPPPKEADDEDRRDVVTAFASGILGLASIDADPVRSRESDSALPVHRGAPGTRARPRRSSRSSERSRRRPSRRSARLPLETFYPAKERQGCVLALNNILRVAGDGRVPEGGRARRRHHDGPGRGRKSRGSPSSPSRTSRTANGSSSSRRCFPA